MNDFSEIQYGQSLLQRCWNKHESGQRMQKLLERCQSGLSRNFERRFDSYTIDRARNSYITSLSLHADTEKDEDKYGRLSMWRAYGGDTNVALVLNQEQLFDDDGPENTFVSPVLYADEYTFEQKFCDLISGLENEEAFLRELGPDEVLNNIFHAFHFAVLSTKHPGFREEQEWRVVHSPLLTPSRNLEEKIEVIGGIPQKIYKILLDTNHRGQSYINELIHKIIIGPTSYPEPIRAALIEEMVNAGIEDAENKVFISNIPFRR